MTPKHNLFVMSVDVDSWSSLLRFYSIEHDTKEANAQVDIGSGITTLLKLFEKHDLRATFFVPGEVAQSEGPAVKLVVQAGHEIACHGMTHDKNECLAPLNEQISSIAEASMALKRVTGNTPKGFRAPCLRANGDTARALEELEYIYDSSVLPGFVPRYYGYLSGLQRPYHPSFASLHKQGSSKILELPVSVNPFLRVPISAAWMRNLGINWVKASVSANFSRGNPVMFYIHPRDVSALPKTKGLPWHVYKSAGQKTSSMLDKLLGHVKKHAMIVTGLEVANALRSSRELAQSARLS